ncbi:MAG: hypothetical protein HYR88_16795, partial [Verrucomicrobia bacterium]|nr:hypothetical protein [Verrucomicrobiota bacterium]
MPKNISYLSAFLHKHRPLSLAAVLAIMGILGLALHRLPGARAATPPDSDGDGQNDLAEFLAGTDPHDARSVFRILGEPIRLKPGLWRVTWQSVSNRSYTVQRLADSAPDFADSKWIDLATVQADGPTTFFDAPVAAARGFFRVKSIGAPDAPVLLAPIALTNGGWRVFWSSVAGRDYELQRATQPQGANAQWRDLAHVVATGPASFADDFAGTVVGSRFYRVLELPPPPPDSIPTTLTNATQFVALGGDGRPQEGGTVKAVADGTIPAFEFRPGGRSGAGAGAGLALRFPQGARVVEQSGQQFLEFTSATSLFGPGSPLQLKTALNKSGGSTKRIPMGNLSVADILTAFDLPPESGLELVLFGQFHITLKSGIFADGRLKQARFSVSLGGLPLPGVSGDYPEFSLDLPPTDGVRIPFYGDFTLPDGSASPPTLSIPPKHPMWLVIKPDGLPSLTGRADLRFPDGPSFSVDLGIDDPVYSLQMVATGVHVPLIGSLAALLPSAPESCLPSNPTAAQLASARQCLARYDCAYVNFSASAVGAGPASDPSSPPDSPPEEFGTTTSVLDAWSYSALAATEARLPLAPLKDLLRQTGRSATAGRDLSQVVCNQLALTRARQAMSAGAFDGDSAARAELDAALAEAGAAAIRSADSSEAAQNLPNLIAAARCVLEVQAILQSIDNSRLDPALSAALSRLFKRFAADETDRLGVVRDVFAPAEGGPIGSMNRFVALQKMKDWGEFLGDAQQLGIEMEVDAPIDESMGQLALRVWRLAQDKLNEAESANDYLGFLFAMEDILDIVRLRQAGVLPGNPALAVLPADSDLPGYGARLGQVFQRDPTAMGGDVALENQSAELRRLRRILREVPGSVASNRVGLVDGFEFGSFVESDYFPKNRFVVAFVAGRTNDHLIFHRACLRFHQRHEGHKAFAQTRRN